MKIKIPTYKDELSSRSMKYCLFHPKKLANTWTGHLIIGKKTVTVGYCGDECLNTPNGMPQGCIGNFRRLK